MKVIKLLIVVIVFTACREKIKHEVNTGIPMDVAKMLSHRMDCFEKLVGPVKNIEIKRYFANEKFGEVEKLALKKQSMITLKFDRIGNLTEKHYIFDKHGQFYHFQNNEPVDEKSLFEMSQFSKFSSKRLLETSLYRMDSLEEKVIYKYKEGNSEENFYNGNGDLKYKNKLKYNDKELLIKEAKYDELGQEVWVYFYEYNNERKIVKMDVRVSTKLVSFIRRERHKAKRGVFEYSEGRLTSIVMIDKDPIDFVYNNEGQLYQELVRSKEWDKNSETEVSSSKTGTIEKRYKWDIHNNCLSFEEYDESSQFIYGFSCDYTYDTYGNWVKKIVRIEDRRSWSVDHDAYYEIIERQITYFD